MKLDVVIPDYPKSKTGDRRKAKTAGLRWRRDIHAAIAEKVAEREIRYLRDADLDVNIVLFMGEQQMRVHDIDNLTKHVFDALQGKLGGRGKAVQKHRAVVPNDAQMHRLTIEKRKRGTSKQKSRLIVTGYVARKKVSALRSQPRSQVRWPRRWAPNTTTTAG
jgi:Holliday junction resolvase RusA-like endonuclease